IYDASFVFFFQAEDGIRDKLVTGVQTCALPISQLSELVIFGSQGHVYIGPAPPTPIRPIRQDDQAVWRELLNPSQETSDEINYEVGSRRSILREKSTNPQGCWSSVIGARILKRKI